MRSIFPLGVSGRRSRITIALGTMKSGSFSRRWARSSPSSLPDALACGTAKRRTSSASGLDEGRASRATFTVYCFVIGYVIEEQAVRPMPGEFDERYRDSAGEAVLGDADARFEDGLAMVLSGARQWLETA